MEMGGAVIAIENGYMKRSLVESNARRIRNIESGAQTVVGVNKFIESEKSPLVEGLDSAFLTVDDSVEDEQIKLLQDFRKQRNSKKVEEALDSLKEAAVSGKNIMENSMFCAECGVTTGEWANALREIFGEYRAPTGVSGVSMVSQAIPEVGKVIEKVKKLNKRLGRNLKILVGKPGLDGHSNGAEQIAVKAKEVGMEVVYDGIRLTPEQIAESALQEGVHIIGLSVLSGSHMWLVKEVMRCMQERGIEDIPIVLGGIIPEDDTKKLLEFVKGVYTPKDYNLNIIMDEIIDVVALSNNIVLDK